MAYRFRSSDKSVSAGLRRIAASEFAQLREVLANRALPADRKIHEARKTTKRLRALLRLVEPACPAARSEIGSLREAAASLSALRDRGALGETLSRLDLPEPSAKLLRTGLEVKTTAARAQRQLLAAFAADMNTVRTRAEDWTLFAEGWNALQPGLERSHRRFRKAFKAARGARDEEPVHEFRKRAKDHWYHTCLLRSVLPPVMEGYAGAAESLCDDLGDWRDLGLLEDAVREMPASQLPQADAAAALKVIAKSRRKALKRAFRMAERLAAEPPGVYTARLKAWWKAAR
jgi:CHAD domain-containing protein